MGSRMSGDQLGRLLDRLGDRDRGGDRQVTDHEHAWVEADVVKAPDDYQHTLGLRLTLCGICGQAKNPEARDRDFSEGWRWEHCSPWLLDEGVSCGLQPRRACQCPKGGSHDHLVQRGWPDDPEVREA